MICSCHPDKTIVEKFALEMTRKDAEIEAMRVNHIGEFTAMVAKIKSLEAVLAAARDLIDLELSEDIPESFLTEWTALQFALKMYQEREIL